MPDLAEIRVYDQTRTKRVKRGAAACALLLLVGMIVDGLALHYVPELLVDSFWIGRPADHQLPSAFFLPAIGIFSCIVPYCMYYGAVRDNKGCLCIGGLFTWVFCGLMTVVLIPMIHLVTTIPKIEAGLDNVQEYYHDCDPRICCDVMVTELTPGVIQAAACDAETGLPFAEYEQAYLDCLLGADPEYVRSTTVNPRNVYLASDPVEDFACKWSLLYLTDCDRFDDEFKVYVNNWAYDMKDALNSSMADQNLTLMPPILIGEEGDQKPWKRIPVPPGWEPGMPLTGPNGSATGSNATATETTRRVQEEVVDEEEKIEEEIYDEGMADVSEDEVAWQKFGDDLEKFNWTKLATNPKNPGPFKMKHLFKSDLNKCEYRPEALEDATAAKETYVPSLKQALSLYIVASFFIVLCGICISAYSCAVTFHLCCCGKKEPDYYGV